MRGYFLHYKHDAARKPKQIIRFKIYEHDMEGHNKNIALQIFHRCKNCISIDIKIIDGFDGNVSSTSVSSRVSNASVIQLVI